MERRRRKQGVCGIHWNVSTDAGLRTRSGCRESAKV